VRCTVRGTATKWTRPRWGLRALDGFRGSNQRRFTGSGWYVCGDRTIAPTEITLKIRRRKAGTLRDPDIVRLLARGRPRCHIRGI